MTRSHLPCASPALLILLGLWGVCGAQCRRGIGCVCLECPAGQEPSKACGEARGLDGGVRCQDCTAGTFSDSQDAERCRPHTVCQVLNRWAVRGGTWRTDAACGSCLPGFHPTAPRKASSLHACVRKSARRLRRSVSKGAPWGSGVGAVNATGVRSPEEKGTEYAVFALVPIFCIMGLLGILICNLLKKRGFHCPPADKEPGDEEATATPQKEGNPCPYTVEDTMNEDTISVLVRLITEKKENAAALEELLLEYESKQMAISKASSIKFPVLAHLGPFRSLPRLCPHQHHLHTISGLAPRSGICCSRCSHRKWPELLVPPPLQSNAQARLPINTHTSSSMATKNAMPPELTILSVGRFQVAQIPENKPISMETTLTESSDTDSVSSAHTEPADEKSLLGVFSSSNSASSRSRQEMNI